MNLIEKIKEQKQKQNKGFIKPEIVEVVIDNYNEIKEALSSGYGYEDVELVLFNRSVEPFLIADIYYIAGKVLEKYNITTAQAESKAETQAETKKEPEPEQEPAKETDWIKHEPSRISIARYMRDKHTPGYVVEFLMNNNQKYKHLLWLVSPSVERAKNTALVYLYDKDKKTGQKNSYKIFDVKKMTYNEYLEKYNC